VGRKRGLVPEYGMKRSKRNCGASEGEGACGRRAVYGAPGGLQGVCLRATEKRVPVHEAHTHGAVRLCADVARFSEQRVRSESGRAVGFPRCGLLRLGEVCSGRNW